MQKVLVFSNIFIILGAVFFYSLFAEEEKKEVLPRTPTKAIKIIEKDSHYVTLNYNSENTNRKVFILAKGKEFISDSVFGKILKGNERYSEFKELIDLKSCENLFGNVKIIFEIAGKKKYSFSLLGLTAETEYQLSIFEIIAGKTKKEPMQGKVEFFNFKTLAKEPEKQAVLTGFKNIRKNEMTLMCKKGDGKRLWVFVSEESEPELPTDGVEYKPDSVFLKGDKIGKSTYCVFAGTGERTIYAPVKGLKAGTKYYFLVVESNGSGESINYLTRLVSSKNKKGITTLLEEPIALEAVEVKENSFVARWQKVKGGLVYVLQVALDSTFQKPVPEYDGVDVGDIDAIPIEELPKSDVYYFRVKAFGEHTQSEYSNIIKVRTKQ